MSIINKISNFLNELIPNNDGWKNYHEITRRLPPTELKEVEIQIAKIPSLKKEKAMDELIQHIKKGAWDQIDFYDRDTCLYALEAVKRNRLSPLEFGTLQMFWSSFNFHPKENVQLIPLFLTNGTINPEAKKIISNSLLLPGSASDQEVDQYFETMRSKPVSEHYFLLTPRSYPKGLKHTETILDVATKRLEFNILGLYQSTSEIVSSFGMMENILKIRFKDQALQLNPVLGLSSDQDLEHLTHRDVAVMFPGVTNPIVADGIAAPAHLFSYHDGMYHAYHASSVPIAHRKLYNELSHIAKNCGLETLQGMFADREFRLYTDPSSQKQDLTTIFWTTVKTTVEREKQMGYLDTAQENLFYSRVESALAYHPIMKDFVKAT